jgi:hypothetical protein
VGLAERHEQRPVRAEREVAAVVVAVLRREAVEQVLHVGARVPVGEDPDQAVARVGGVGVVEVDPRLRGERRVQRDAEQSRSRRRRSRPGA